MERRKTMEYNSQLRKLQLIELNILKLFAKICEENSLRYFLIGGTMLGAVRHEGFIPWDDDVDIGMPRSDYEKFLCIVQEKLPEHFSLLNYKTTDKYLRYFSRLVDERVKVHNVSNTNKLVEEAWIDIFPLDGMPNNAILQKIHFLTLSFERVMYHFSCFEDMVNLNRPGRPQYQRIIIKIGEKTRFGRNMDTKKLLRNIEKKLMKYPYDGSKFMVNFFGAYVFKEVVDKDLLGEGKKYRFEDTYLNGPLKYEPYLSQFYGDYMKPPSNADKDKHNIEKIEFNGEVI